MTTPTTSDPARRVSPVARALWLLVATAFLAGAQSVAASSPLLTRNQYAPLLAFYDPPPLPATPPPAWRFAATLDYSSLFQLEDGLASGGTVDMELARLGLHVGRRIGKRLAVDVELPFLWTGGGFLDDFVSDWHATFGLPNGRRDEVPADRHRYRLVVDGETVIAEDAGDAGLGDAGLSFTWLVTRPAAPVAAALRFGIKAPTGGSHLSLRGSGGWDYALGMALEARRSPWSTSLDFAVIYPTGVSEVAVDPFATGLASVAWSGFDGLDLLAELAGRTSPYDTGVEIFDDSAVELRLGVRHAVGHGSALEVAFIEDLTHRTTPDFSVHLAWRLSSGG